MFSSFTKSTIKNQNTQLTEKSVGITIRMFPDYPIEKSQYPINKKSVGITQFTKISYLELWLPFLTNPRYLDLSYKMDLGIVLEVKISVF